MSKKTYRIYKAGGANEGKILNPTAQFLARAEQGMQQPSQDEMQMMQQQQQQQLMQLVQAYSQIMQTSPEEVMQELQQASPENQQIIIQEMSQVVQQEMSGQEQGAEQQQLMERGGYVKMRMKELKEAQEGLEQEDSSVPTINDTPDGREAFVSEFTDAVKMSASDAARRKQAEEEFDSGNIPMARFGKNKARRNTRQEDRRAVRKADRESDMYSIPDRRLLRRGLREGDFTREEMLRKDNVLGKVGYPYMANPGLESKDMQRSQEIAPGDFRMTTKYGLFGRPRRVDIDYTGQIPFNLMSPLMTGMFGQGFPTNTAYGQVYQSGIRYEDPITTAAKIINKDQTITDAEKEKEKKRQADKAKGSSKTNSIKEYDLTDFGIEGKGSYLEQLGLPSVMDIINKNAAKATDAKKPTYIVDESRPINQSDLVVGRSAIDMVGPAMTPGRTARMLNPGQRLLEAPGGTQFTLFQPGGFVDPNDSGYGNPDLYKFISGGMDQADIDYMNSKDVTDAYMAQDGLEVYQDKGEVKDTFDPRYASPVDQRFNNNYGYNMNQGYYRSRPNPNWQPTPGFSPDPRMQYRPQQGFPMPAVGYSGGYNMQRPIRSANPFGMLLGAASGNVFGFRNAGRPPVFTRQGSYLTQTKFPNQPVDMSNLANFEGKFRQGLFGPKGKFKYTFNTPGIGKKPTDPLITLDKNKGSMVEGSSYMTNREFARNQMQNDPNMSGRDKRELRRQLNRNQTTQLEYLDRQADVKSMENKPNAGKTMPSGTGSKSFTTEKVYEPMEVMDGSGQMRKQGPGVQPMPLRPADQIQTGGYDAPTGPAAGALLPQDYPQVQPTYSFGQPPRMYGGEYEDGGYYQEGGGAGSIEFDPNLSFEPSDDENERLQQMLRQSMLSSRGAYASGASANMGPGNGPGLSPPLPEPLVEGPDPIEEPDPYAGNTPTQSQRAPRMKRQGARNSATNNFLANLVGNKGRGRRRYSNRFAFNKKLQEGGEYDLTEAEIGLIMQAGGVVEYV